MNKLLIALNRLLAKLKKIRLFYLVKILSSLVVQSVSLVLIFFLPVAEYGRLAIIISIAQLMYVLTSGWTNGALINLGSKHFEERGSFIDIVAYRSVIMSGAFVLVTAVFLLLLDKTGRFLGAADAYKVVYILFLGYVFYDFASQLLYPANRNLLQSAAELVSSIVLLSMIVAVVRNVEDYAKVYMAMSFVFFVFIVAVFFSIEKISSFSWDNAQFRLVFVYSAWQMVSIAAIYVMNLGMNYVLVGAEISYDEIGRYNFAYRFFMSMSPIFALFGVLIPKWMHGENKLNFKVNIDKHMYAVSASLAALYLLIYLILGPFIKLIGKAEYLPSVVYFIYLFPAFIFMSYANLMNTIFANTRHFKRCQAAIAIQAVVLLIFSIPLVSYYRIPGAICAVTLSFFAGAVYMKNLYRKLQDDL